MSKHKNICLWAGFSGIPNYLFSANRRPADGSTFLCSEGKP